MTVVGDMDDVLGKAMERPAATPATEQTPAISPGELLKPTLLRLAGLALPASYLWLILFIGMRHPNPNWAGLAAPALLALSAVLAIAHRQRFALSAAILVGRMCLAATAEIAVGHYGAGQWLILASIIVAGTLLGPVVAAPAALALGIVALLFPTAGRRPGACSLKSLSERDWQQAPDCEACGAVCDITLSKEVARIGRRLGLLRRNVEPRWLSVGHIVRQAPPGAAHC